MRDVPLSAALKKRTTALLTAQIIAKQLFVHCVCVCFIHASRTLTES